MLYCVLNPPCADYNYWTTTTTTTITILLTKCLGQGHPMCPSGQFQPIGTASQQAPPHGFSMLSGHGTEAQRLTTSLLGWFQNYQIARRPQSLDDPELEPKEVQHKLKAFLLLWWRAWCWQLPPHCILLRKQQIMCLKGCTRRKPPTDFWSVIYGQISTHGKQEPNRSLGKVIEWMVAIMRL